MVAIPELNEPLVDPPVRLRRAAERDIPEILIAHQDDPELHARLGQERPPTGAELGRLSERADEDRLAGRALALSITEQTADTCLGQVDVHRLEWTHARGELGIWLAPQARGRGFAAPALHLAARWLLEDCGLQRVEIHTEPTNQLMLGAARSAGFHFEGVLRAYRRQRGRRVDQAVLSLVPEDLPGQGQPE